MLFVGLGVAVDRGRPDLVGQVVSVERPRPRGGAVARSRGHPLVAARSSRFTPTGIGPSHGDRRVHHVTPNVAAADHESQPYRHEENELTDVRAGGSGWPTTIPCGACGNLEGNLAVWYSWWCSRNGVGRIWGGAAVG